MAYYLLRLLLDGEILYFSFLAGVISICKYYYQLIYSVMVQLFFSVYFLMNKTIGESKISKGSSYGTNTPKKIQADK